MTGEGRSESARAEIDLADEELRAAEALLADGLPRIAVGRIYFALFHAVRAQLYAEGFEPRTHRGAQHLFNLHFVRTGRFEPATSGLIARLQKFREEADYAPTFLVDVEGARHDLEAARGMIEAVQEHLDDLEDLYLAEQRLIDLRAGKSETVPLDELMRRYGVDGRA